MATDIENCQLNLCISEHQSEKIRVSSNKMFRQIGMSIMRHPFIKTLAKKEQLCQSSLLSNRNVVKPKMFLKLITWMEKLCSKTLDFSVETFQLSVLILRSYVEKGNCSISELQMLGSVCLHIASKVNEKTIIAVESYRECCMNIFTKQQFEEKEAEVYQTLGCQLPTFTAHQALYFLQSQILSKKDFPTVQVERIQNILKQSIFQLNFMEIDTLTLVCNLLVEASYNSSFDFRSEDFLSLLKARKIQF